jgi:hypothetical protein
VAGQSGLRVESLGFAVEDDARLAERVDRSHQLGDGATGKIEIVTAGGEHRPILGGAALGHELGEAIGKCVPVADDPARMDADRPGVDGPGERNAVAVDDVGARRNQGIGERGGPGSVGEGLKVGEPQHDQAGDTGEQQQDQHQPVIGQSEAVLFFLASWNGSVDIIGQCRHQLRLLPPRSVRDSVRRSRRVRSSSNDDARAGADVAGRACAVTGRGGVTARRDGVVAGRVGATAGCDGVIAGRTWAFARRDGAPA